MLVGAEKSFLLSFTPLLAEKRYSLAYDVHNPVVVQQDWVLSAPAASTYRALMDKASRLAENARPIAFGSFGSLLEACQADVPSWDPAQLSTAAGVLQYLGSMHRAMQAGFLQADSLYERELAGAAHADTGLEKASELRRGAFFTLEEQAVEEAAWQAVIGTRDLHRVSLEQSAGSQRVGFVDELVVRREPLPLVGDMELNPRAVPSDLPVTGSETAVEFQPFRADADVQDWEDCEERSQTILIGDLHAAPKREVIREADRERASRAADVVPQADIVKLEAMSLDPSALLDAPDVQAVRVESAYQGDLVEGVAAAGRIVSSELTTDTMAARYDSLLEVQDVETGEKNHDLQIVDSPQVELSPRAVDQEKLLPSERVEPIYWGTLGTTSTGEKSNPTAEVEDRTAARLVERDDILGQRSEPVDGKRILQLIEEIEAEVQAGLAWQHDAQEQVAERGTRSLNLPAADVEAMESGGNESISDAGVAPFELGSTDERGREAGSAEMPSGHLRAEEDVEVLFSSETNRPVQMEQTVPVAWDVSEFRSDDQREVELFEFVDADGGFGGEGAVVEFMTEAIHGRESDTSVVRDELIQTEKDQLPAGEAELDPVLGVEVGCVEPAVEDSFVRGDRHALEAFEDPLVLSVVRLLEILHGAEAVEFMKSNYTHLLQGLEDRVEWVELAGVDGGGDLRKLAESELRLEIDSGVARVDRFELRTEAGSVVETCEVAGSDPARELHVERVDGLKLSAQYPEAVEAQAGWSEQSVSMDRGETLSIERQDRASHGGQREVYVIEPVRADQFDLHEEVLLEVPDRADHAARQEAGFEVFDSADHAEEREVLVEMLDRADHSALEDVTLDALERAEQFVQSEALWEVYDESEQHSAQYETFMEIQNRSDLGIVQEAALEIHERTQDAGQREAILEDQDQTHPAVPQEAIDNIQDRADHAAQFETLLEHHAQTEHSAQYEAHLDIQDQAEHSMAQHEAHLDIQDQSDHSMAQHEAHPEPQVQAEQSMAQHEAHLDIQVQADQTIAQHEADLDTKDQAEQRMAQHDALLDHHNLANQSAQHEAIFETYDVSHHGNQHESLLESQDRASHAAQYETQREHHDQANHSAQQDTLLEHHVPTQHAAQHEALFEIQNQASNAAQYETQREHHDQANHSAQQDVVLEGLAPSHRANQQEALFESKAQADRPAQYESLLEHHVPTQHAAQHEALFEIQNRASHAAQYETHRERHDLATHPAQQDGVLEGQAPSHRANQQEALFESKAQADRPAQYESLLEHHVPTQHAAQHEALFEIQNRASHAAQYETHRERHDLANHSAQQDGVLEGQAPSHRANQQEALFESKAQADRPAQYETLLEHHVPTLHAAQHEALFEIQNRASHAAQYETHRERHDLANHSAQQDVVLEGQAPSHRANQQEALFESKAQADRSAQYESLLEHHVPTQHAEQHEALFEIQNQASHADQYETQREHHDLANHSAQQDVVLEGLAPSHRANQQEALFESKARADRSAQYESLLEHQDSAPQVGQHEALFESQAQANRPAQHETHLEHHDPASNAARHDVLLQPVQHATTNPELETLLEALHEAGSFDEYDAVLAISTETTRENTADADISRARSATSSHTLESTLDPANQARRKKRIFTLFTNRSGQAAQRKKSLHTTVSHDIEASRTHRVTTDVATDETAAQKHRLETIVSTEDTALLEHNPEPKKAKKIWLILGKLQSWSIWNWKKTR